MPDSGDDQVSVAALADRLSSHAKQEKEDMVFGQNSGLNETAILKMLSSYPDVLSVVKTNKENLRRLIGMSHEWFSRRLNIIDSYCGDIHYLSWRLFILNQPLFITDEYFDFITDPKWPLLLRDYALTFLSNPNEITINQLAERMEFIQKFISEIALESDIFSRSESLKELLIFNFDFLRFYRSVALDDEWRVVIGDGNKRKYLRDLIYNATYVSHDDRQQDYESWKKRDIFPIDFDDSFSEEKENILAFIQRSSFDDLAKPIVGKILFTSAVKKNSFSDFSGKMEIFCTGPDIVKALFHELGHAFHKFLRQDTQYHELLYQYVLELSVYNALYFFSDSYTLAEGKNTYQHIAESFAEDFRWFWFLPEAVPKSRFRVIGKMAELVFPDIRAGHIRENLKSVLHDLYNVEADSKEMVVSVVCDVQKVFDQPNISSSDPSPH